MRHDRLIDRLGGYRALAERLGRHPSTVFRWQTTGIPAELWPAIVRLAREEGVRVSVQALMRTSPLYGEQMKDSDAPQVS